MRINSGFKACYNCTERFPSCHDSCKKYAEEKRRHEEMLKKIRIENDARGYCADKAYKLKRDFGTR